MKKLSKLIAVLAAMVLLMSMSASVFAVSSPVDDDVVVSTPGGGSGYYEEDDWTPTEAEALTYNAYVSVDNLKGTGAEWKALDDKMVKNLKDEKYLKEEVLKNYEVPEGAELEVVWAADVDLCTWDKDGNPVPYKGEFPEEGLELCFYVFAEGLAEGDVVYVIHYNEDGTWDVQESTVEKDAAGDLYVMGTFKSLSPVGLLKVTVKGEDGKPVNFKLEKKSPGTGL